MPWEQKLLCKAADTDPTIAAIPGRQSLVPASDNIWTLVHPDKKFPLHTASDYSHEVTSDKIGMVSLELMWLHRESHSSLI